MKSLRYRAEVSGHSLGASHNALFRTITGARKWAESFGSTADNCSIFAKYGNIAVARHVRNPETGRWYKAV